MQSELALPQQGVRRPAVAIAFFYVIALGLSYAAAQLPATKEIAGYSVDRGMLIGLGPLVATCMACLMLRQKFPSLFGQTLPVGLLALLVPIALVAFTGFGSLAAAGVPGLIFGASIVVYCLCEEAGWRGFLTTNLSWLKDWHADLLSGGLWFAWHFTFMPELYDPSYTIGFVAAILAGAFGLAATRRFTGGFALAAGWHAAVKLFPIGPLAFGLIALLAILTWQSKKASAGQ